LYRYTAGIDFAEKSGSIMVASGTTHSKSYYMNNYQRLAAAHGFNTILGFGLFFGVSEAAVGWRLYWLITGILSCLFVGINYQKALGETNEENQKK
jgi:hypothetical protein